MNRFNIQQFATGDGVYQVNGITFTINTAGRTTPGTQAVVKDMETFTMAFDNGVEEWTPMDTEGWIRRLMTAKSITVSLAGKRNIGDPGNDYVAGLSMVNGQDANSILEMTFPNGDKLSLPCVVNVTSCWGGDSTNVGGLEFDCMSDGKPTYTEATP